MKDIDCTPNIPDSTRIRATFSWFAPVNFSTELSEPSKDRRILVNDSYSNTPLTNNNTSLAKEKASEHGAIFFSLDKETAFRDRDISKLAFGCDELTHRIAVNGKSLCQFPSVGPGVIESQKLIRHTYQSPLSNRWSQLNTVAQEKLPDWCIGTLVFPRKIINRFSHTITRNNFVAYRLQKNRDALFTHKDTLIYKLTHYQCFLHVNGKLKKMPALDGKIWNQMP